MTTFIRMTIIDRYIKSDVSVNVLAELISVHYSILANVSLKYNALKEKPLKHHIANTRRT